MDLVDTESSKSASNVARSHHILKLNPQFLSYRKSQKKSVCSHAFKIGSYGKEDGKFDSPSHVTAVRFLPSFFNHIHSTHTYNDTQIGNHCIVVSDSGNNRLQLFDVEGRWICSVNSSSRNDTTTKNSGKARNQGFTIPGGVLAARMFELDGETGLELSQNPQRFGLFVCENLNVPSSAAKTMQAKFTFYDVNMESLSKALESSITRALRREVRGHEIFVHQNWLSYDRIANKRFGACVHCGNPSDLNSAIRGDVCGFCIKMFVLLVIQHSCEESLVKLNKKTEEIECLRSLSDTTEYQSLQDSIDRLNEELKYLYSSTQSFLDYQSFSTAYVQDKRVINLAKSIMELLHKNNITYSGRVRAKLSLSQILQNLERRKRQGQIISGIEIDALYYMRRSQRARVGQEEDKITDLEEKKQQRGNINENNNSSAPKKLFQELVPPSRLELKSQEHKQIEIGFAWVARPFVKSASLKFMIDGERKTAYSTSRAPVPKNTIFGHGNDEVLIVEFNQSVPLTSLEIDFEIPPLRKNEPIEKMVLHAPRMWSVECYDTEIESGHNNLERVDGGQDAYFPSDWNEIVLRLAPWEISTILGFENECKDTFDAHSKIKNVKTSVKRFPQAHMKVIREQPEMRGYYAELKLQGSKVHLKDARDAVLNCVCRSNFRKPLFDESANNHRVASIASFIASNIQKINYKHPAFDELKRIGVADENKNNEEGEKKDKDENLRVLECVRELFEKKQLSSDPSFMIGTSWIVFGEKKSNRGLVTFRPTKVTLVCRYLDDGEVTETYEIRAQKRREEISKRQLEYFHTPSITREYLAKFDETYGTNLLDKDSAQERENIVMGKDDTKFLSKAAKNMGNTYLYIESIKDDFEWFPLNDVSELIESEWIMDGEYRDHDGTILPLRLRKLVLRDLNIFAIWTKHGIQVFGKPNCEFEIRTLKTPSLVHQLQEFMQSGGKSMKLEKEEKVVIKDEKEEEKEEETLTHHPQQLSAIPKPPKLSIKPSRPHRELRHVLQYLNMSNKFYSHKRAFELRKYRLFEECTNTMFTELKTFTTWGLHKDSINEGLKEAHKVCVLLPWEFHLIFGGPWLSSQNGKKQSSSVRHHHLMDKIRREAECDCIRILKSDLEIDKKIELPITIEFQKEENRAAGEKYDEIWKLHITARSRFLADFASDILMSEFERRTTMLHYKFEDPEDDDMYTSNNKTNHHNKIYFHRDPPSVYPCKKCIVRTERCDAEGHEFGQCRIHKIMSDGSYIVMHTHKGFKSLSHKVKRYDIYTTPKLTKKQKNHIISLMNRSVTDEEKLISNPAFIDREELARSAYYLFKDGEIKVHIYSTVLSTLFPFLTVPICKRVASGPATLRGGNGVLNPQSMFAESVYMTHSGDDLGRIIRMPILHCDDVGSFCARLKHLNEINSDILGDNQGGEVFLSVEKILSLDHDPSPQNVLPSNLLVRKSLLHRDDSFTSKALQKAVKSWKLYTGGDNDNNNTKTYSFLEICAMHAGWSHRMKLKGARGDIAQITMYFIQDLKATRAISSHESLTPDVWPLKGMLVLELDVEARIPRTSLSLSLSHTHTHTHFSQLTCNTHTHTHTHTYTGTRKFDSNSLLKSSSSRSNDERSNDTADSDESNGAKVLNKEKCTMKEKLETIMHKFTNLASMQRNEIMEESRLFGIRFERNDSTQKMRRLLNTKLEETILALRSRLVRRYERQSVDLVLANDDSRNRNIRVQSLVRVFIDGEIETKKWKKGRLLAIYSNETCLVRTRNGTKLQTDIVLTSHVKPWHSAMFLKIKMKGAHFLNSSKPQLGVSAVKLSQRQFHPDEGPHSFEDRCWGLKRFRSLMRRIPRPSESQVMAVMYEKDKLMSGYRHEENISVDLNTYISMGYSSWLHSTSSQTTNSSLIATTDNESATSNGIFKRFTLPNDFGKKTEALKRPNGIALGRRSRDIKTGLCKATQCILNGTLLESLRVPGEKNTPPSRHDCLSDSTKMSLAIPFTQVPGFNVMEAKLSIVDLMSKASKMQSLRGQSTVSPLSLPVVVCT
jgi:hypothetical protein